MTYRKIVPHQFHLRSNWPDMVFSSSGPVTLAAHHDIALRSGKLDYHMKGAAGDWLGLGVIPQIEKGSLL